MEGELVSTATVTNYKKRSGIKQHKLSYCSGSHDVQNGSPWAKIKVLIRLCSFRRL